MKIGIIGLGKISKRVAKGIQCAKDAELYAIASRSLDKAERMKQKLGAQKAYGSYEALCQDPKVEMVYICTPNPLHKEHIMLCLSYHKHVICEKPMVGNRQDVKECFAYAKQQGCFLMEAHKTVHTPLNQKLKQMIDDGVIGKLLYIEAGYCTRLSLTQVDMAPWCFREEDGGCFYDIGVYPIAYANFFAGSDLKEIAVMKENAKEGYCIQAQGMLKYENDSMALVRSSWKTNILNQAYLYGEDGYIVCENFWKNTEAFLIKGEERVQICVEMESDFEPEVSHAVSCIQNGLLESPVMGYHQSDQILQVLKNPL